MIDWRETPVVCLVFAAIDMVLTPDDRYVFLELNPNGQWEWIGYAPGALYDRIIATGSYYKVPLLPCLIDVTSDTMLVFHPTEQNDTWVVEIKGQKHIWDGVVQVYNWREGHPQEGAIISSLDISVAV